MKHARTYFAVTVFCFIGQHNIIFLARLFSRERDLLDLLLSLSFCTFDM